MRKHRCFERIGGPKLTVQVPYLSPRGLMNLLSDDVEIDIKARAGLYGNGSESFPIPRTMSISKLAAMAPRRSHISPPPVPPVPEPASAE